MFQDEHFAKVLPKLKTEGYLIGLLTNNVFRTAEKKRSVIIENAMKKFDAVVESCREGVRKPNPQIYLVSLVYLFKKGSTDWKLTLYSTFFTNKSRYFM